MLKSAIFHSELGNTLFFASLLCCFFVETSKTHSTTDHGLEKIFTVWFVGLMITTTTPPWSHMTFWAPWSNGVDLSIRKFGPYVECTCFPQQHCICFIFQNQRLSDLEAGFDKKSVSLMNLLRMFERWQELRGKLKLCCEQCRKGQAMKRWMKVNTCCTLNQPIYGHSETSTKTWEKSRKRVCYGTLTTEEFYTARGIQKNNGD